MATLLVYYLIYSDWYRSSSLFSFCLFIYKRLNFYEPLLNIYKKIFICYFLLLKLCRDWSMPNAWLQHARFMLLFCQSCSAFYNIYCVKFCATAFLCPDFERRHLCSSVGDLDIRSRSLYV